jgi:DNA-directed RNA polymerase subunit RPC12/RpoP
MFKAGEKPGIGTYKCLECGELVTLDDPDDVLPACPVCHYTEYEEI